MKKILLIGNFGAKNLGDELILDAALDEYGVENCIVMTADEVFSKKFTQREFETIPPFPTGVRSLFKFLFSKRYRRRICDQRENISKVVFAGGGLFAIKMRAYFLWWVTSHWVKYLFPYVPVFWEYQGLDYPHNNLKKYFIIRALEGMKHFSVRDEASLHVFENLGINGECELKNDRVFAFLEKNEVKLKKLKKEKVLLFNAVTPAHSRELRKVMKKASIEGLDLVFIAFDARDLNNIPRIFDGKVIFPETKDYLFHNFATAEVIVGERFHSLVLGEFFCPKQTFTLREPYSQKVRNFCEKYKIGVTK